MSFRTTMSPSFTISLFRPQIERLGPEVGETKHDKPCSAATFNDSKKGQIPAATARRQKEPPPFPNSLTARRQSKAEAMAQSAVCFFEVLTEQAFVWVQVGPTNISLLETATCTLKMFGASLMRDQDSPTWQQLFDISPIRNMYAWNLHVPFNSPMKITFPGNLGTRPR